MKKFQDVKKQIIIRTIIISYLIVSLSIFGFAGNNVYKFLFFSIPFLIFVFINYFLIKKGIWVENSDLKSRYTFPLIFLLALFHLIIIVNDKSNIYIFLFSNLIIVIMINYLDYKKFYK